MSQLKAPVPRQVDWDDDAAFLLSERPPYEALRPRVRLVDLFCGCGGLSLGIAEAARRLNLGIEVPLAVDLDDDAVAVYRANFPSANAVLGPVEHFFDGESGGALTRAERKISRAIPPVDVLVGGPPCQGHSDLNNHTRRDDPRNSVYAKMARAAEVLRPSVVIIENVPTVQHDAKRVVDTTVEALKETGYRVDHRVINLATLGVPQRRRRHVVLASCLSDLDPKALLSSLDAQSPRHSTRTVRWAIKDLLDVHREGLFDTASTPSALNLQRMNWLLKYDRYDLPNRMRPQCHASDHSYNSMYGRLVWDAPAQTLTTGFGSMGQGRYVHPAKPRTLTPHEAARLQMIPDFWDFSPVRTRTSLARLIGNAVPPVLATAVAQPALRLLFGGAEAFASPQGGAGEPPAGNGKESARIGSRARSGSPPGYKRHNLPHPSSEEAHRRLRAVRQSDTAAERLFRHELEQLGLTHEVDQPPVKGFRRRADILFVDVRVAVFVDGCFWHGCPKHATYPRANADWWRSKLRVNQERDRDTDRLLRERGWVVLRFWEHDDAQTCARAIESVVSYRRALEVGRRPTASSGVT